ncbi:MAG: hypothetical protein WA758_05520 [Candidatus Acidiferrales bacterium]
MKRQIAEARPRSTGTVVQRLAELFPEAVLMRLPVEITQLRAAGAGPKENTLIEFGTANEALFASTLPLEFADRVRITNTDGSLNAEASVVAVHFELGRRAVAVRFSEKLTNWIIQ